jgi:hypothetical protein
MSSAPPLPKQLYYHLTPEVAQELRQADPALTAAEWRLWSLLVTLDPFGDTLPRHARPAGHIRPVQHEQVHVLRGACQI